jgi:hypothetical protein
MPDTGDIVTCPTCDSRFEVVGVNPLELDWPWDDDEDLDGDEDGEAIDEDWEEDWEDEWHEAEEDVLEYEEIDEDDLDGSDDTLSDDAFDYSRIKRRH